MKNFRLIIFSLALIVGTGASVTQGYAQWAVGMGYLAIMSDYAGGMKWFRAAAEKGHATSQTILGMYHVISGESIQDPAYFLDSNGELDTKKVEKGIAEGVKWLRLAAEQGHEDAQYVLADLESEVVD